MAACRGWYSWPRQQAVQTITAEKGKALGAAYALQFAAVTGFVPAAQLA
jgi:hypothetical protein